MKYTVFSTPSIPKTADCLIVGLAELELGSASTAVLNDIALTHIESAIRGGDFGGRLGETLLLRPIQSSIGRILLVGLGKRERDGRISRRSYCIALDSSAESLLRTGAMDAANYLSQEDVIETDIYYRVRYAVESLAKVRYRATDLKTEHKLPVPPLTYYSVATVEEDRVIGKSAVRDAQAIVAGQKFMRDLANLPANICTPSFLAEAAANLTQEHKSVTVRVFGEPYLRRHKMGAFLAVAKGSDTPPSLIIARYQGTSDIERPIVLIGKGITFDTGGISLKSPIAMDEMKFDMSGAACVLGALKAAAQLELAMNIIAVVPACENMPGPRATKPGDIVRTMSGYTVEVLNTDAEGRLILCDALTYVRRFKPTVVIDVATLTGACFIALGRQFSGLFSNNSSLASQLVQAGARSNDFAWRLPHTEEDFEQLKSSFADFANVAGREGGASVAAAFLAKFVPDDVNWAHLDIAGSAYVEGTKKGSTGRPIALLVDYLLHEQ